MGKSEGEKGLFWWIRKTPVYTFVVYWVISIFVFTFVYWLLTLVNPGLYVGGVLLSSNFNGLLDSLYASFLTATIFGVIKISYGPIFKIFLYIQLIFSAFVVLVLIDKLLQRYIFPHYVISHSQDKKINTMVLMMSIFRSDIDRIKSEFKAKTKHDVDITEIEAMIDGLYVTFLDIDKMFSVKNVHKHRISENQSLMVITGIEDSLHKLSRFIDFLGDHKIDWKDRSVEFWIRYILETADRITLHFDDIKVTNPKLVISIENIKELTQSIEKKI